MPLIRPARASGAVNWRGWDAAQVARRLGLGTGLVLALDPGSAASYSTGQSWLDLSGNGYDFLRGSTSGAEAEDPTFNGSAGRLSSGEYWSFDGGDYFTYDTSNETWMNNLHKDNAAFTWATWVYAGAIGTAMALMGNRAAALTQIGVFIAIAAAGTVQLNVANGSGTVSMSAVCAATIPSGEWRFVAVSEDEASGTCVIQIGETSESLAGTYSSPSSSNATSTLAIGARATQAPLVSGSRMGPVWAWTRALPASELMALYMATRGRFNR